MNRLDDALIAAGVPDGAARRLDATRERRLGNELVTPHRIEQLHFGHDSIAMLDEMAQDVEDLWLHMHRGAVEQQLVPRGVDHDVAEQVLHHEPPAEGQWGDGLVACLVAA